MTIQMVGQAIWTGWVWWDVKRAVDERAVVIPRMKGKWASSCCEESQCRGMSGLPWTSWSTTWRTMKDKGKREEGKKELGID